MTRAITAIFALLIMVSTPVSIAQPANPIEELKACARMPDRDTRLACFDILGERVLREESADKKPTQEKVAQPEAATTVPATNAQPLPEDPRLPEREDDQESKTVEFSEMITSCKQDHFGYWYFFLDNGQVWKEVKKRNRRYKECSFNATFTKERFGYDMRIDALDRTVRVKRHK